MTTAVCLVALKASLRFCEVSFVNFEPYKLFHAAFLGCDRRIAYAKKGIQHCLHARSAVQLDAPLGQSHWKCRRMGTLLGAALNCFVRNKPGVPTATQIASAGMRPAGDVALVLIRDAGRAAIDFDTARLREMKNVLMTIIQKSL